MWILQGRLQIKCCDGSVTHFCHPELVSGSNREAQEYYPTVTPAKAGVQERLNILDSCFREGMT
jgi:hypothetical protein